MDQTIEKTVGKTTLTKLSDEKLSEEAKTSDKKKDFSFYKDNLKDIIAFLKPAIDILIKEELSDPNLLDELFSLNFSDLVKVVHHLLSQSDDIELTYTNLILGAKKHGIQKFVEEILNTGSEKKYEKFSQDFTLETITRFLSSYDGNYEVELLQDMFIKIFLFLF